MTLKEFDKAYRIATGLNFINLKWIIKHNPTSYKDKVVYFIKLRGYIELLKSSYYGGKLKKYGRFDPFTGVYSELVKKLIEIIFGINAYISEDVPATLDKGILYLVDKGGKDYYDGYENINGKNTYTGEYLILNYLPTDGADYPQIKILKPIKDSNNLYELYIYNIHTEKYVKSLKLITINKTLIKYLLVDDTEYLLTESGEKIILT